MPNVVYDAAVLRAQLEELERRGVIDIKVTLNPECPYPILKQNALRDVEKFLAAYIQGKGVEVGVEDEGAE